MPSCRLLPLCRQAPSRLDLKTVFVYQGRMKFLVILLSLAATSALADVTGPNGRVVECFCTDTEGLRVELGETTCLYVDGRAFMATCDMSINMPTWRDTGQACLSSLVEPERSPRERLLHLVQPPV